MTHPQADTDFNAILAALPEDNPLRVRYEEAKCGLHILNESLARMNLHISNIRRQIMDNYKI